MHSLVARNIFRLQELALGRPSFKVLSELQASQYCTDKEMQALRLRRLQKIVRSAYEHTSYWKGLMNNSGIVAMPCG